MNAFKRIFKDMPLICCGGLNVIDAECGNQTDDHANYCGDGKGVPQGLGDLPASIVRLLGDIDRDHPRRVNPESTEPRIWNGHAETPVGEVGVLSKDSPCRRKWAILDFVADWQAEYEDKSLN